MHKCKCKVYQIKNSVDFIPTNENIFIVSDFVSYNNPDTYLQCTDGGALETQISFEVLGNLSNQTLEWQLADQQLSGLLIPTNLTQSHSTGPADKKDA